MKFRAITCLRRGLRARLRLAVSDYLRLAILLLALLPLGGFAHLGTRIYHVIDNRIRTFHELEMYEGDMTLHAIRVLEGRELYPSRNGDYIPLLYTPLYSYLHAWMMKLVDKSDRPHTIYSGRIVAVMASAGIALVILLWVLRETGNWMAALGAAGFFIGVNPLVGWWYDLARVDTAHVFFVALGSWAFLDRKSPKDWHEILKGILGGLFFSLGFFTKQTAGQIAIGLTVLAALISPLRALWGIAAGLTFGGFGLIYFNVKNTDFWYLTVTVPSNHLLMLTEGWKQEVKKDFFLPRKAGLECHLRVGGAGRAPQALALGALFYRHDLDRILQHEGPPDHRRLPQSLHPLLVLHCASDRFRCRKLQSTRRRRETGILHHDPHRHPARA
ncbi:hypothetical protein HYR69_03595, partial [Candidatus Sumerlaeota bacterium]|nr:hypothetical protein [Candidatus Sumerlaeota bacterium]